MCGCLAGIEKNRDGHLSGTWTLTLTRSKMGGGGRLPGIIGTCMFTVRHSAVVLQCSKLHLCSCNSSKVIDPQQGTSSVHRTSCWYSLNEEADHEFTMETVLSTCTCARHGT